MDDRVVMKEKGIALRLFHRGMKFKRLQQLLLDGVGDSFNQEKWFQYSIMSVWFNDGMPAINTEQQAKYFNTIKDDALCSSILKIYGSSIKLDLDQAASLDEKLKSMDLIKIRLENDDQYRLSLDDFKQLVTIRLGSYPANIHPIFKGLV